MRPIAATAAFAPAADCATQYFGRVGVDARFRSVDHQGHSVRVVARLSVGGFVQDDAVADVERHAQVRAEFLCAAIDLVGGGGPVYDSM